MTHHERDGETVGRNVTSVNEGAVVARLSSSLRPLAVGRPAVGSRILHKAARPPTNLDVAGHEINGVPVAKAARSLSLRLFTVYARLRKGRRELATSFHGLSRES